MASERTFVTELATGLGMLGDADLDAVLARRPSEFVNLSPSDWDRLADLWAHGRCGGEFVDGFLNGRAFLEAPDALRGRAPRIIEWTGGRRPPGDEVAPIDLRIDHVYLISCKYESDILANASPARLFDGLMATAGTWERTDWYAVVAPEELTTLYRACLAATGLTSLPDTPSGCSREELGQLRDALGGRTYPDSQSRAAYADLCRAVSDASVRRWADQLESSGIAKETMLWRL